MADDDFRVTAVQITARYLIGIALENVAPIKVIGFLVHDYTVRLEESEISVALRRHDDGALRSVEIGSFDRSVERFDIRPVDRPVQRPKFSFKTEGLEKSLGSENELS